MFSELLHGVIGRTQQEAGISEHDPTVMLQPCDLHIGIIPAGEHLHSSVTDMLAEEGGDCSLFIALMHCLDSERSVSLPPCVYSTGSTDCVCFTTIGINDPVTSTLHIIIGNLHIIFDGCQNVNFLRDVNKKMSVKTKLFNSIFFLF